MCRSLSVYSNARPVIASFRGQAAHNEPRPRRGISQKRGWGRPIPQTVTLIRNINICRNKPRVPKLLHASFQHRVPLFVENQKFPSVPNPRAGLLLTCPCVTHYSLLKYMPRVCHAVVKLSGSFHNCWGWVSSVLLLTPFARKIHSSDCFHASIQYLSTIEYINRRHLQHTRLICLSTRQNISSPSCLLPLFVPRGAHASLRQRPSPTVGEVMLRVE